MSPAFGNLTNNPSAAQAFNRFGFGGRPDDAAPADVMGWLSAQITCADQAPSGPSSLQAMAQSHTAESAPLGSALRVSLVAQTVAGYRNEVQSMVTTAVTTKIPFRERLVWFWTNHFAVMANHTSYTLACAGPYVREAIRPNVTGTIAQMLLAAILHPAMLTSLNAPDSTGPNSPRAIGVLKQTGVQLNINENLGRETLELYSLGYNQGYVQADVDALATLLSGMDVGATATAPAAAFYNTQKQQPGNVTLMGTTYPCTQAGLASALQMLGTHPNTYLHLATKLVTHFVSDTPSQADIATICNALASTGGSLPAAHSALLGLQNAWVPLQKLKSPVELMLSALRAAGTTAASMPANIYMVATALGESIWSPDFPDGWSDFAADWNGPAAMMLRTDWAWQFAGTLTAINPAQTVLATVAPFLSAGTSAALSGAGSAQTQFALLFCSPEFQRR